VLRFHKFHDFSGSWLNNYVGLCRILRFPQHFIVAWTIFNYLCDSSACYLMNSISAYIDNPWLYWVLVAAYSITILSIVGIVLSENRNPLKSLAWVTVLILFPLGGIILYIFFGRSIKNTRMISRRNRRRLLEHSREPGVSSNLHRQTTDSRQQIQLARSLVGAEYYDGNHVEIFTKASDKMNALLADIREAKKYIHLQYYIIDDDNTGRKLADALIEAARRGVRVRVIYDDIGSSGMTRRYLKALRAEGIEISPFFRVTFPPFGSRINWRNHRKIGVIDGRRGYIGGMNIADRYINGGNFDCWRDTHLRITGPAVSALQYAFAVDWNFMGNPLLSETAGFESPLPPGHGAGIQLVTSGPTSRWSNVAMIMLKAIGNAKRRIYLQTPYFLPTESLLKALQAAALSRVDVRVMMPRRSDSAILTAASASYIEECLRAGIKIYLYGDGMLHAKTMLVDDEFVTAGSTNFDFRSFEHNFEANIVIHSRYVNNCFADIFVEDMKACRRVKTSEWRRRHPLRKVIESIVRLLSPIL